MRARLALKAAGVQVALREVLLRDKPAELLSANPQGTVPVLVLATGEVLAQSLDIMHWALAQHDPLGWRAAPGSARAVPRSTGSRPTTAASSACWTATNTWAAIPARRARPRAHRPWPSTWGRWRPCGGPCGPAAAGAAQQPARRRADAFRAPVRPGRCAVVGPGAFAGLRQWLAGWQDSALWAEAMQPGPPWRAGDAERIF
jgi:UPF0176 protein